MNVCMCSCCMHICMLACMHVCMYVCMWGYMYECMYVCMYVCFFCEYIWDIYDHIWTIYGNTKTIYDNVQIKNAFTWPTYDHTWATYDQRVGNETQYQQFKETRSVCTYQLLFEFKRRLTEEHLTKFKPTGDQRKHVHAHSNIAGMTQFLRGGRHVSADTRAFWTIQVPDVPTCVLKLPRKHNQCNNNMQHFGGVPWQITTITSTATVTTTATTTTTTTTTTCNTSKEIRDK